jgi:hypothetical protein
MSAEDCMVLTEGDILNLLHARLTQCEGLTTGNNTFDILMASVAREIFLSIQLMRREEELRARTATGPPAPPKKPPQQRPTTGGKKPNIGGKKPTTATMGGKKPRTHEAQVKPDQEGWIQPVDE